MKLELIAVTPDPEGVIEIAGRECYQSDIGNRKIIQNWIKSGHTSVIEHASATFRLSGVSRAESHQHVRHRIASYSQKSQRYVKEDAFDYITPPSILEHTDPSVLETYTSLMDNIQSCYTYLINKKIKKEDARFVLPNACETSFVFTMNFRSMRNFFELRRDSHSQWEIRSVANEMLTIVKPLAPNVFYDIE